MMHRNLCRAFLRTPLVLCVLSAAVFPLRADELLVSTGNEVRRYDEAGILVGTMSDPTLQAHGVRIGPDGLCYVSNFARQSVLRFDPVSGAPRPCPTCSGADFVRMQSGGLVSPHGLIFRPSGELLVASIGTTNGLLQYEGTTGAFLGAFTSGGAQFPRGVTIGPSGDIFVTSNNNILRYPPTGGSSPTIFASHAAGGNTHFDLAFGSAGQLFLSSFNTDKVLRYDGATGAFLGDFVTAGSGGLNGPVGIAFAPDGSLYVASALTNQVLRYDGATGAFLGAFVTGLSIAPQYLTFRTSPPPPVTLTSVEPAEHPEGGGTPIDIFGSGFTTGIRFRVNGQLLTNVQVITSGKASALTPSNPAGLYALEALAAGGATVVATLPEAVSYEPIRPNAPQDIEVVHLHDEVRLRWSLPEEYSQIEVRRGGAVVATMPGSARSYVDDLSGVMLGQQIEYELVGIDAGGVRSESVRALAHDDEQHTVPCSPVTSPSCILPIGVGINIFGSEANEAQTGFTLSGPTINGITFAVLYRRTNLDGTLRARIRDTNGVILRDNLPIGDLAISASYGIRTGVVTGALAAGNYVLGLYSINGDPADVQFSLQQCSAMDLGPPFPCPPYPAVILRAFECGSIPPVIGEIRVQPSTRFGLRPLEKRITVTASAFDGAPNTIVQYKYIWGDGQSAISASPSVFHIYPTYGSYPLTVEATDAHGLSVSASKTVTVKPTVSIPAAGSPPVITYWNPAASSRAWIPDISSPTVTETFVALVTPAIGSAIPTTDPTAVQMRMRHPVTNAILATQNAVKVDPSDPDPNTFWKASFNMSALPRLSSVVLEVTARDDQPLSASPVRVTLQLCPLPEAFRQPFVLTTISVAPDLTYSLEGKITPATVGSALVQGVSPSLPLGIGALSNKIEFSVTAKIKMKNKRYFDGNLVGEIRHQAFSSPLFSQTWTANPTTTSFLDCPDFGIVFNFTNIRIFEKTWNKALFENKNIAGPFCLVSIPPSAPAGFICANLTASLYLEFFAKVFLDLQLTLRDQTPYLTVASCLRPSGGLGAGTSASLTINFTLLPRLFRFASGTAALLPTASLEIPTRIDILPAFDIRPRVCFRLDVDYELSVSYWWFGNRTRSFGRRDIGFLNNLSWGGGCGQNPCGLFDGPQNGPMPESPNVPSIKYPAIAVSPDGARSLAVYIRDMDESPDFGSPELYFVSRVGGGAWSAPAPLRLPEDFNADSQPELVFINNSEAILVWTRNRATFEETDLVENIENFNQLFSTTEIFTASWNAATGWSAFRAVTNDSLADAVPRLARIPGQDAAMCVFVKNDGPMLAPDGQPIDQTSVWAARINAGGLPEEPRRLSSADSSAEFSASVAFAPAAPIGYAVWAREPGLSADRELVYAAYDGMTWSTPQLALPDSAPPGVDAPSLALSGPEDGLLAFTAREEVTGETIAFGAGEQVYTAPFNGRLNGIPFGPTTALAPSRCAVDSFSLPASPPQLATDPRVIHLGGGRYALGARTFTADGRFDADSEALLATIDLARPGPTWAVRTLTRDDATDLEIVFGGRDSDTVTMIRSSSAGPAARDGLVFQDVLVQPDLAVERIDLSEPYAKPGRRVEVRAVLRNAGLRVCSPGVQATTARLGMLIDGSFVELDAVPVTFDAAADQTETVAFLLLAPADSSRLRVQVDALAEELVTNNNALDFDLGVPSPSDMSCGVVM